MDDIIALKQVPLFSRMDDEEASGLHALMELKAFAPGQTIINAGEEGDQFYIVVQGNVQFFVPRGDGDEIMVEEAGPGEFFGELSMLTGEPRAARVRAADEVKTLAIGRASFFGFLEQHPPAAIDMLVVLGQRLHRTDQLLLNSSSRNVNELADKELTTGERIAEAMANFSGSVVFLVMSAIWFGFWVLWNQPWFPVPHFDPPPFILLTTIVSLESIFLSIFVLISQNLQTEKDRLASEVDHNVNTKAEMEVGLLLLRVQDIERSMHYHLEEQTALLRALSQSRPGQPSAE